MQLSQFVSDTWLIPADQSLMARNTHGTTMLISMRESEHDREREHQQCTSHEELSNTKRRVVFIEYNLAILRSSGES